jgi:hypothetical protein
LAFAPIKKSIAKQSLTIFVNKPTTNLKPLCNFFALLIKLGCFGTSNPTQMPKHCFQILQKSTQLLVTGIDEIYSQAYHAIQKKNEKNSN